MNSSAAPGPDPRYRTILVPLDGSHFAAGALPTARALAARFNGTVHTVSVVVSDYDAARVRAEAAQALGTDPDDERIHVEVDTDVAVGVHRRASVLGSCLLCLSTHGRGRVASTVIGSTARDIVVLGRAPVVVAGPWVVHPDTARNTNVAPLGADHLVACVDGTPASESGLPTAAAWANALGMKLTLLTVAEPCLPPVRIGAPWRRHHGPNEDADKYIDRLAAQWTLAAPGLDTAVVYDPISPAAGLEQYLAAHPTGLVAVTTHLPDRLEHAVSGSGAEDLVHSSSAPALVVPVPAAEV